MTKFETIGVQAQMDANDKEHALKSFQWSCNCCCFRGMVINGGCDRCAIAAAHRQSVAIFDDMARLASSSEQRAE